MINNKQSSVEMLWNLIPKDTQNYIVKQFDGYTKAKVKHKDEIERAYTMGNRLEHYDATETVGEKYHKETYETLAGEAEK